MSRRLLHVALLILGLLVFVGRASAQIQIAEGSKNIFVPTIAAGALKEPMLQLSITNPVGGAAAQVTQVRVTAASNGTGHDVNDLTSGSVQLYWDTDNDGHYTAASDMLIATGAYGADNGTVTFAGLNLGVAAGAKLNLMVVYTLGAGATAGESYRARIAANGDVLVRNASTLAAMTVSGAPVEGYLRTVGRGTVTITRIAQAPDGAIAVPNVRLLPLINLELLANDVENVTITHFSFQDIGTANAVTGIYPNSVTVYVGNSKPTVASLPAATGQFTTDNGVITLQLYIPLVLQRGTSQRIWLTMDVVDAASEIPGRKYQVTVPVNAPFTATGLFSGLPPTVIGSGVNGPEWEFNYTPVYYSKSSDLGAVLVANNAINAPLLSFMIDNDPVGKNEKLTFTRFDFHGQGTINEATDIQQVKLWRDVPPYGRLNDTDVLLATVPFSADNGVASCLFAGTPLVLSPGAKGYFLLTADMAGNTAADGKTIKVALLTRGDIGAMGEISLSNAALIPVPFESAIKTVGQPRAELTLETAELRVPSVVAPEATMFPLLGIRVKNGNDEDMKLQGLRLKFTGALNELNFFRAFYLHYDVAGDGKVDPTDVQLSVAQVLAAASGDATLDILTPEAAEYLIARGQSRNFTLYGDIATTVSGNGSEVFNIVASNDAAIAAVGSSSRTQFQFTTPQPPFSLARTIRNPAISLTQYPAPSVALGCINGSYGMVGSRFQIGPAEDLLIQRVRFTMSGTLDDGKYIDSAACWHDLNKDLLLSVGELGKPFGWRYTEDPVSSDNGTGLIDFTATPGRMERFDEAELSVMVDYICTDPAAAQAQQGRTATSAMIGTMTIEGIGSRSGRPIEVTNTPGDDLSRTIQFSHGDCSVTTGPLTRWVGPPAGNALEVFSLRLTTDILEPVRVDSLRLRMLGTINESTHIRPGGIKVWIDDNRNGKKDAPDYLYAQLDPPATDNGDVVLLPQHYLGSNTVYSFSVNSGRPYDTLLFTVDLATTAPEGSTIQMQLQNQSDLSLTGALSLMPYVNGREVTWPIAPPLTGHPILVQRGAVELKVSPAFLSDADNKPMVTMAPRAIGYEVLRMDLKATAAEDVRITGLTIRSTGTANELADIKPNGAGLFLNSTLLTSGTFTADNGALVFQNFSTTVTAISTTPAVLSVKLTGSGSGGLNKTMDWSIAGADLQGVGLSSLLPITQLLPVNPLLPPRIRFGPGRLIVRATGADAYILPIPGAKPALIQPLTFTASRTEALTINEMAVHGVGTANEPLAIQNGALQFNRRSGSTVIPVASAPFQVNDGTASLRSLAIDLAADANTATNYSLDVAVNPDHAVSSTTLQMNLDSTSTVVAVGRISAWPAEVVFEDTTTGENRLNAPDLTGVRVILSTGLVMLRKGNVVLPDANIVGGEKKLTLLNMRLEAIKGLEGVTITGFRVNAAGSVNEALSLGTLLLYQDVDADGKASAADVLLSQAPCSADNAQIHFSGLNVTLPENTITNWVVASDVKTTNFYPMTLKLELPMFDILDGQGQLTEMPLSTRQAEPPPLPVTYTYLFVPKNSAADWLCYD